MGNLFPLLRDIDDFRHKLWDHIHIMSDFKLDVDSPYPKPARETFQEKPKHLNYPQSKIRFGHYGKTIERIINDASLEDDEEKRKQMAVGIANLMKRTYVVWHQSAVKDETIVNDLKTLSNGKLVVENPEVLAPVNQIIQQMGISADSNQNRGKKRSNTNRNKMRKKRN